MKNTSTLMFLLLLIAAHLSAQDILFFEDFEDNSMSPFTVHNLDGIEDTEFKTEETFDSQGNGVYAMVKVGSSAFQTDANDWMITPQIENITANSYVSWRVRSRVSGSVGGAYRVLVSTTGNQPSDFTDAPVYETTAESEAWIDRIVSLADYAGQDVFIAFQVVTPWGGWLMYFNDIQVANLQMNDLAVEAISASDKYFMVEENFQIPVAVRNVGLNEVNSFVVTLNDGTETYTKEVNNVNLTFNKLTTVNVNVKMDNPVGYTFISAITAVNGTNDSNLSNNEAALSLQGLAFEPLRKILTEKGTATWCGSCTGAMALFRNLEEDYPDRFIGVSVHYEDIMEVSEYADALGLTIYPSARMNRGETTSTHSFYFPDAWSLELAKKTPVEVSQVVTYDPDTRTISSTATATFATSFAAIDCHFGAIVTENNFQGSGSAYDQANWLSGFPDQDPIFGNLPNPVPSEDMVYQHLARAIPGGFNGVANSGPVSAEVNQSYSHDFTYTIPDEYNEDEISFIVHLTDQTTGLVLNSHEVKLKDLVVSTNEEVADAFALNIFPNPANEQMTVALDLQEKAEVELAIFNVLGQQVMTQNFGTQTGATNLSLDSSDWQDGIYLLQLTIGEEQVTQRVRKIGN